MAASTVPDQADCLLLNSTIINLLKAVGLEGDIPCSSSISFSRFQSRYSHNCDLCIPIIGGDLPWAEIVLGHFWDEHKTSRISFNLKKIKEELPLISKSWDLPIKSCSFSKHCFCIYLDREKALSSTLPGIVEKGGQYGLFPQNGKKICLTRDPVADLKDLDLVQLRVEVAFQSLSNVYQRLGYSVMESENNLILKHTDILHIHLCNKSVCNSRPPRSILLLCGAVQTSVDGDNETSVTAEFYHRHKEKKLRLVEKNKGLNEENSMQVMKLSKAETIAELLFVKLHNNMYINFNDSVRSLTDIRGASFLLYNHVRLLSLRRKFEELSRKEAYPVLPPIHSVNFGLLTQEEEWDLFLLILKFPLWLLSCVSNVNKEKASLHPLLIGLDKLCRVTSVYYRRIRILTEPRVHLLPVMFARLYLLYAVESVLKSGLSILGIDTLDYM